MPRLLTEEMEEGVIGGNNNFKFSGIRTEHLGASEFTLVTAAVDVTGSVQGFEKELRDCLITAIDSCKKSPRSENLLFRVILFCDSFPNGIMEVHGFKPLADIDSKDYEKFNPSGSTPLYDAAYSAIGATNAYAERLHADEFPSNGIVFIITDGDDNSSSMRPGNVKQEIERGIKGEFIESNLVVLIGVNAGHFSGRLQEFQQEAGIDKYIDAGDATPGKLAKLAAFVSNSVSSQSQSLGTGGPSQNISAVI
jgi:uncharacterized protein YegL